MGNFIVLSLVWGFIFWLVYNYWSELGTAVLGTILGDPLIAEIKNFLW